MRGVAGSLLDHSRTFRRKFLLFRRKLVRDPFESSCDDGGGEFSLFRYNRKRVETASNSRCFQIKFESDRVSA